MQARTFQKFFLASLVVTTVSCELFTTRTPENPEGTGNGGWQFPESPEAALENLNSAMGRRSSADYLRLFLHDNQSYPEFRFYPDPVSNASNPGIFDEWNTSREQKHCQSLFAPVNLPLDSLLTLETVIDRQTTLADTANLTVSYRLYVGHKIADRSRDFEGRAEFRLLRIDDGGWYILSWTDFRTTGKSCWSDLKALF